MRYIFRRLGFAISPAWLVAILLIGLVVGAAFWVGPLRPLPPELQLLVMQPDGAFTDSLDVPVQHRNGDTRFPLVLGARNVGYNAARPDVLELSVPLGFQLVDRDGRPYPRRTMPGNPLAHYALGLSAPTLAPGSVPELLLDTIWLQTDIASYTCTVLSDGVPEFMPAPSIDVALMSRIDVFYSFRSPDTDTRQAGLLKLHVDSSTLRQPAPLMGEAGVPVLSELEAQRPEMSGLYQSATTETQCGDPQQPVPLQSVVYTNDAGGRFLVVYHDGAPRKYLFDMNGDSIVEREMWDPDADGSFEASRTTRYSIPAFLFPSSADHVLLAADTVPPDSAFLALYADTLSGPFRFAAALRPPSPGSDTVAGPAVAVARPQPSATLPTGAPIPADTTPADAAWLQLYGDTAAGPFRFADRERQRADSVARAVATGDTATADTAVAEPAPPRRTGPRILGTPVEYPPGSRPPP